SLDWDDYDMKQPVMKTPMPSQKVMELVQEMYKVSFAPEFILRKLFSLRDLDDLTYSARALKKVFGHVFDFRGEK
ncbi:MAG: B12-binding domain-containing radical SAM protein, partial [Candidatus Omnitrophica bacterium]|nr:B12-binding domain-containing radical SAM protein [Candidatus Omnitrophota bacterium]